MRIMTWTLAGLALASISSLKLHAQWANTYSAMGGSLGGSLVSGQATADGGYIAVGQTEVVIKLKPDGSVDWARRIRSSAPGFQYFQLIRQTRDGGYVAAAELHSTIYPYRRETLWIVKLSPLGVVEWERTFSWPGKDFVVKGIRQTLGDDGNPDGYIVSGAGPAEIFWGWLSGFSLLKLDTEGALEWQRHYTLWNYFILTHGNLVEQLFDRDGKPDGYVAVTTPTPQDWPFIWVLRLSRTGDLLWHKPLRSRKFNLVYDMRVTLDAEGQADGLVIVGSVGGQDQDGLWYLTVLKLTLTGDVVWWKHYGPSDGVYYVPNAGIAQTADRGYAVAAQAPDVNSAWILRLRSDGTSLWQRTYRSGSYTHGQQIDAVPGGFLVSGRESGSTLLVMRLNADGDIPGCTLSTPVELASMDATSWDFGPLSPGVGEMTPVTGSTGYSESPVSITVTPICGAPQNRPPVASAGPDQTVTCACAAGKPVTLDGSASYDPDGDALSCTWTGPFGTLTGAVIQPTLAPGTHGVALTVNDGHGGEAGDSALVIVQPDTTPPQLNLSQTSIQVVLPTASAPGATVDFSGMASAADECAANVPVTHDGPALFPAGTTTVTFTAADACGNARQRQLTVRVLWNFGGFLPPVRSDGSSIFATGRVIPIKFQLTAADGSFIRNATARLRVTKLTGAILGTSEEITPEAPGSSNTDNYFRYDLTAEQYIYNLFTAGYGVGTYLLEAVVSDGTTYSVQVSMR